MKTKRGFTLVELIVVITIIAVLTAVGVISYGGITKKSRDSRRMTDLGKYQLALEMARQVGSTYPVNLPALVPLYLPGGVLSDPKTGFLYLYVPGATPYTYSLYAQMEDPASANLVPAANDCGGVGVNTCNYKVTNP
jgi:prepilin-type N-terminal cleavage/methylation domain-containing protein